MRVQNHLLLALLTVLVLILSSCLPAAMAAPVVERDWEPQPNAGITVPDYYPTPTTPLLYSNQTASKDNYIRGNGAKANHGTDTGMLVGLQVYRSLIEFDISEITWANYTVNGATLKLYYYDWLLADPVGEIIQAYRLTRSNWDETDSCWDCYDLCGDGCTAWTTAGGDYDIAFYAEDTVPAGFGWMEWDITDHIKDAIANRSNLVELELRMEDEDVVDLAYYYSSEYVADTTKQPLLEIDYDIIPPSIDTVTPTDVVFEAANLRGNITSITTGDTINTRGFVWANSTQENPGDTAPADSTYSNYWTEGAGVGDYSAEAFSHIIATTNPGIFNRACANTTNGWVYADEITYWNVWDASNRIEVTASPVLIDATLTNHIVTLILDSSSGTNTADLTYLFDSLGNDSLQIAITEDDEETPLYVKVEYWDSVTELAVVHCSESSWELSDISGTSFFLYFDPNAGDNSGYVSTTYRPEVYDDNYIAVYNASEGAFYSQNIYAFGDSITTGVGASDAAHYYRNVVATDVAPYIDPTKWVALDYSQSAGQIGDFADEVYSITSGTAGNRPSALKSLMLAGYNDMRSYGTNAAAQSAFGLALSAEVAYLSIVHDNPSDNFRTGRDGSGLTFNGDWTNTPVYGIGKYADNTGDYVEFTIHGEVIYVGYIILVGDQNGTTFELKIDGDDKGSYSCEGGPFLSAGLTYNPALLRFTGLSDDDHTVRITHDGANLDNIYFDWAGGADNSTDFWLGNCLRMTAAGYAAGGGDYDNGSKQAVDEFNTVISTIATNLSGDGLKVYYVDVDSYYDIDTDVAVDNIHPDDSGHQAIADAFVASMADTTMTYSTGVMESTANNITLIEGIDTVFSATYTPTEVSGKVGYAMDFDGSDDFLATDNDSLLTNVGNFTLEVWVNVDNAPASGNSTRFISETDDYDSADSNLGITIAEGTPDTIVGHLEDSDSTEYAEWADGVTEDTWYHTSIFRDDDNLYIWGNGALEDTEAIDGATDTLAEYRIVIASQNDIGGSYSSFDGLVDEIRLSDVIRSDAERKASYNFQTDSILSYGSMKEGPFIPSVIRGGMMMGPDLTFF